jgi:hypothetical protein
MVSCGVVVSEQSLVQSAGATGDEYQHSAGQGGPPPGPPSLPELHISLQLELPAGNSRVFIGRKICAP